jgi:two-component system, NarL family, sensor histidine kinase UhpB
LGLAAAIEGQSAALAEKTRIRYLISPVTTELRLGRQESVALFRIAQEALTNVVRHAHASAVRIHLRQAARHFKLTIHDNGRGISQAELSDARSIGLLGMRERAQMVGGRLEVTGRRGHGTTVTVTIPTPAPEGLRRRRATSHASRPAG